MYIPVVWVISTSWSVEKVQGGLFGCTFGNELSFGTCKRAHPIDEKT